MYTSFLFSCALIVSFFAQAASPAAGTGTSIVRVNHMDKPPANTLDLSGRWTFTMDRDFRGNRSVAGECVLKQKRSALRVKCGNSTVEMIGDVDGRSARWQLEISGIPPMTEDRVVLSYHADTNESGTTLTGAWTLTSSVLNERGTFEARKKR